MVALIPGGSDPPPAAPSKTDSLDTFFQRGAKINGKSTVKVMQDRTVLCQDLQHGRCKATGSCPKNSHRCAVITKRTRVCGSPSHGAKDCRVSTKA